MKRALVVLVGLLLAAAAAWGGCRLLGGSSDAESASTGQRVEAVVERHDFVSNVLSTGTVKPKVGARVNVGARTSGKVEKLNVGVGDPVVTGQVLAVIEHEDLEAQVKQKEVMLEATRTQVRAEKTRAEADLARLEATLEQRRVELAVERKRLESIRDQRQSTLDAEERRLASIRDQRKAELGVARAQSLESAASLDYVRKDMKRMKELFDRGMLPEQSLDKAATDVSTSEWRAKTSKGQTLLAQTRLVQEVALQEEGVRLAKGALTNDVAVQEETVRKAETAILVAERELAAARAASEATVVVLEASLPRLEAELDEVRTRLGYASVRAPINGVVGSVSTQEGETVAAGFNAPTFVTVVDLSQLQVDAYVDEVDIGKVAPGQHAPFVVDAFPDTVFEGVVKTIYPSAILQENVVYYDVVIDITSDFSGRLRPEMTANVTIEVQSRRGALAVPARAVRRTAGTSLVTILTATGTENREVTTGLEDADFTEISAGLQEGDKVVYFQKEERKVADGGPR